MTQKDCSLDASVLRLDDGAPVKVTFLSAAGKGHLIGFYSFSEDGFSDIRTLFPNVGTEALIPKVSSVFLGSRLNGKTPSFFVLENGYGLNKNAEWFQEAASGHGGCWKFLKPASEAELFPALNQGRIVWRRDDGSEAEAAVEADAATVCPVLIWQSNSGRIFVAEGRVFHSAGSGLYPELNPDGQYRFLISPQEDGASVRLDFVDIPTQRKELSFNLHIGERNFKALTDNRVLLGVALPRENIAVSSVIAEISDEFEDTLYLEGLENRKNLTIADTVFSVEGGGTNRLIVTGGASMDAYEPVLSRLKIKTEASAPAESDARLVFKTGTEEIVITGQVDILSDKAQIAVKELPLSKPVVPVSSSERISGFFADVGVLHRSKESVEDLPSFLTQSADLPVATKTPVNAKTVLITGGASKLGGAIAHVFAANGYNVIVHCHTSVAQATHLVEELQQKYHVKASYFRADFNSYEETADMIPSITKTYGTVDVLVYRSAAFVKEETAQGWDMNMAVNLRAPFMLLRSFALSLPKGRNGTIISVFDEPPHELSSYVLATSALSEMLVQAAETYKNKLKVGGLRIVSREADENVNMKIAETVGFLAESPIVSGQILGIDGTGTTEKKASLF